MQVGVVRLNRFTAVSYRSYKSGVSRSVLESTGTEGETPVGESDWTPVDVLEYHGAR